MRKLRHLIAGDFLRQMEWWIYIDDPSLAESSTVMKLMYMVDQSQWNVFNNARRSMSRAVQLLETSEPAAFIHMPPVEQLVDSRQMYYWGTRVQLIRERLKGEG